MAKAQRKGSSSVKRVATKGKTRGSATRGISQMNSRSTSGRRASKSSVFGVGGGIEEV